MFLTFNAQFMKRFQLLFIISLLISFNAYPQLNKKIWLVGGTGSFEAYNYVSTPSGQNAAPGWKDHIKQLDISLKAGYFIIDKLVVGIMPTCTLIKSDSNYNPIASYDFSLAAGPFVRYYLLDKNKPYNLLAEVNGQYGIQWRHNSTDYRGTVSNLSILAGPEFFFNSVVGIEILLGYKMSKEVVNGTNYPYTDVRKGFQAVIGLQVHLKNFRYSQF
jgi:hypothetical protein